MLIVRIEQAPGEPPRTVDFASSPIRIGRNLLNELFLDKPFVSQWHAVVRFEGQRITLVDLGSTNGTVHNGRMLRRRVPVPIQADDRVGIGNVSLSFSIGDAPAERRESTRLGISPLTPDMLNANAFGATRKESGQDAFRTSFYTMCTPAFVRPRLDDSQGDGLRRPCDVAERAEALSQAVDRTRPAHQAYRDAWSEVIRQLRARLESAPELHREAVAHALVQNFPQVMHEPDFRQLIREHGLGATVLDQAEPSEWLLRVKHGTPAEGPDVAADRGVCTELAMERVGGLLEAFAQAYVELRNGYDQFGSDMALQVTRERTPLTAATGMREVLHYLLDWRVDGEQRLEELKRAFADLALHQVALLSGVVEGARELLNKVDPDCPSRASGHALATRTQWYSNWLAQLPWVRSLQSYRRFRRMHQELVEEDRFAQELFGKAFAEAYYTVTGQRLKDARSSQNAEQKATPSGAARLAPSSGLT